MPHQNRESLVVTADDISYMDSSLYAICYGSWPQPSK